MSISSHKYILIMPFAPKNTAQLTLWYQSSKIWQIFLRGKNLTFLITEKNFFKISGRLIRLRRYNQKSDVGYLLNALYRNALSNDFLLLVIFASAIAQCHLSMLPSFLPLVSHWRLKYLWQTQ